MPAQATVATVTNTPAGSGTGSQQHIIWAVNGALFWAFWLDSTDLTTLRCASSPDGVTWTNRTSLTLATNHSSEGQDFSVNYTNLSSVDTIHVIRSSRVTITDFFSSRATMSGTTITWQAESQNGKNDSATAVRTGCTIGHSTDGTVAISRGGPSAIGADVCLISDLGSWTPGTNWQQGTINLNSATDTGSGAIIDVGNFVLCLEDNGFGVFTWNNIWYSLMSYRTAQLENPPTRSMLATALGTAQDPADWGWVRTSGSADVHIVMRTGATTFQHMRYSGVGRGFYVADAIPTFSSLGGGGVSLASDGYYVWAFALASAAGNDISVCKWTPGTGWGAWTAFGLGAATRTKLSVARAVGAAAAMVYWTEGAASPFTLQAYPFAIPLAVPSPPTALDTTIGNAQVTLNWQASGSNGGSAITGYTVTGTPSGSVAVGNVLTATVTGLTSGTTYTFTVHATNAQGNSVESVAVIATPYATADGQGLGAGFGGHGWSGASQNQPTAYITGFPGGRDDAASDRWQKLGRYEPGSLGALQPNPPFPFSTVTTATSAVGGITLGNRLVAGTAVETFTAAGAVTLGTWVVAGAAREQAATGAVVLGNRLVAATAVETFTAAGNVILGDLVVSGAAREQAATGSVVLGSRLVAGTVVETFTAAGAVTLGNLVVSGSAVQQLASGTLVLGNRLVAGSEQEQAATGAVVLGNRLVAGSAIETFTAAGNVILGNLVVTSAAQEQAATGALVLGNRLVAGSAVETFIAVAALVLGNRLVSGAASEQAAAGTLVLGNRLVAGSAIETFLATAALVLGNRLVAGVAAEQVAAGSIVLGDRLVSIAALETFVATAALVLGDRLVTGAVIETFTAVAALVLGNRLVSGAAQEQTAAGGVTLGDRLVTATVLETFIATGALVLGDRRVAGTVVETFLAAGALLLGNRLVAGTVLETFIATGALVLGDRLAAGAAQQQLAAGGVTLGDRLVAATALEIFLATGTLTLGDRRVAGSLLQQLATGGVTLGDRQFAAAALETFSFSAAGALVLGDRIVAGTLLQQLASGALTLGDRQVAATVIETFIAAGALVLGDRLVNAAAIRRFLISVQLSLVIEQLQRLSQRAVAPVTSTGIVQGLRPFGLEAAHRLAPVVILPVERSQRITGSRLTRVEVIQLRQRIAALPLTAGSALQRQALLDLESGVPAPEHPLAWRMSGRGQILIIPQRG